MAVPTASSIRYFTVQEFLDFFNLKEYNADQENGVKPQQIILFGAGVELGIDNDTRSKFDSNSGAYYSVSNEYHDVFNSRANYFLKYTPITSITSIEIETAAEENTDTWTTLTADTDYNYDDETGRIRIKSSSKYPEVGKRHFRANYKYGRSSVPADIKILSIVQTGLMVLGSVFVRSKITDKGTTTEAQLDWFTNYRNNIINKYKNVVIRSI